MASLRTRPDSNGDELIELLLDSADFTKFTPEERVKYQYEMTIERDRRNQETFKINKALAEQREKFARSLLADGMSVEKVSQYTGLTESEIEELYR